MFAIFSALYDSIQASRLILRAPTVSPSIRNMYNSAACFFFPFCFFFFFFFSINIHSYYYQPSATKPSKEKRGLSASGTERRVGGGVAGDDGSAQLFIPLDAQSAANTTPMLFLAHRH